MDFLILSEDVGKLAYLQNDRTLAFHARYGAHYATRIPRFGRSLAYHPPSCDLYIAASGPELYRLNLEEGRFRAPALSQSPSGVNVLAFNPVHMLLGGGGEDGQVEFIDPRNRTALAVLDMTSALAAHVREQVAVSALEFDADGLTYCVGTSSGHALLYDLRSSRALTIKEHQYGLPIVSLRFHHGARKVLSADSKIVKVWERDDAAASSSSDDSEGGKPRGAVLTNIETPAAINDICIVADHRGDSGLLLLAGEQERVMTYYVPSLGPAPRWCSFLDSITEELEEGDGVSGTGAGEGESGGMMTTVYDDYKFVTRQEVEELNATNLIGTPLLRGYMHGFFVDVNLYAKLQAVSKPAAYDEWRKKRLKEKLEAKRASRISFQKALPAVNRSLAERLLKATASKEAAGATADNPLGDSRFASLFTREDFQVDEESDAFKLRNPNGVASHSGGKRRRRGRREGSDSEAEASDDDLAAVVQDSFRRVDDENESEEGGEEDEDEMEVDGNPEGLVTKAKNANKQKQQQRKPKFMEAENGGEDGRAMLLHDHERKQGAKVRLTEKKVPLEERLRQDQKKAGEQGEIKRGKNMMGKRGKLVKLGAQEGGSMVREYTYNPEARRKEMKAGTTGGGRRKS